MVINLVSGFDCSSVFVVLVSPLCASYISLFSACSLLMFCVALDSVACISVQFVFTDPCVCGVWVLRVKNVYSSLMLFRLVLQVVIGGSVSCMFTVFCVSCVTDEGFKWLSFEDMFICGGG